MSKLKVGKISFGQKQDSVQSLNKKKKQEIQTVRFIQLNVWDILLGAYAFFVIGIVIGLWIERD